jgi:hypothetical protein
MGFLDEKSWSVLAHLTDEVPSATERMVRALRFLEKKLMLTNVQNGVQHGAMSTIAKEVYTDWLTMH